MSWAAAAWALVLLVVAVVKGEGGFCGSIHVKGGLVVVGGLVVSARGVFALLWLLGKVNPFVSKWEGDVPS